MLNKRKCTHGANRKLSPWKDAPLSPFKWTSCWMTKESMLTVFKYRGRIFWRSSHCFRIILSQLSYQYLLALVALISRWILTVAGYSKEAPTVLGLHHTNAYQYLLALVALWNFTVKFHGEFKIFGEPRVSPPVLFMIEALNKAILCHLFSVSCKHDAIKWLRTKYSRIHLQTEWDFFSWEFDRLCFSKASRRDSKQNHIFLQRN